ncbi:MAG: response regulator [Deltaproteobacteria bacterium]|nr:response regulator [Deltaproteobacteria bacterium]
MSDIKQPSKGTVLVVDDEPDLCEMVAHFLRAEGYEPVLCTHPGEALELYAQNNFDLAFLDINLPEMSGLELASRLRQADPYVEIVFMTGFGSFDSAIQAIRAGAYDYLRKPFGINDFRLSLQRFQERQGLKKQIRTAEQRYFDLVQNIPCIIFVIRKDFRMEFISRACRWILGFSPEEATSDPEWFLKRVHAEDIHRIRHLFMSAFKGGDSKFSVECRFLHRDGHVIHAMLNSISATGTDTGYGETHIEGIIIDISDRVLLEKSIVQKEKLNVLGAVSAEVAHEIRNPIVSIGGFARRLKKAHPDWHDIDIILEESERLEDILHRVTAYLKPVKVTYQECDVNRLIAECAERVSTGTRPAALRFNLDLEPSLPAIYSDRDLLVEIFSDMITNAGRGTEEYEILHIRTFEGVNHIHVEFMVPRTEANTGFPDEIPSPFDEGEHKTGLSLSYRLLKEMGGLHSFTQEKDHYVFTISLSKSVRPDPGENT